MEVKAITGKPFTRNQCGSSLFEPNKSALTGHASHDNRAIIWPAATILARKSDKSSRYFKEAVRIRKERRRSLNRDAGGYMPSHTSTYNRFLATSHLYHDKNQKKNWTSFWWRSVAETEMSKVKMSGCVEVIHYLLADHHLRCWGHFPREPGLAFYPRLSSSTGSGREP